MPTPTPSKIAFQGLTTSLDTRVHAVRSDLADAALIGQVAVPRFAKPMPMQCIPPFVALRDGSSDTANQTSELLQHEGFMVIDQSDGWAWGFCAHDHYVGYVPISALGPEIEAPLEIAGDQIDTAKSFLDMPYVWGGRGGAGIDCSGLVQRSMAARGILAQRDSDMQLATLGGHLTDDDLLQTGDLVFFPGHVGMMVNGVDMIHATRHYEKVVIEPLANVIARVAAKHDKPVSARKRVFL